MKKFLLLIFTLLLTSTIFVGCSSNDLNNNNEKPSHTHTYVTQVIAPTCSNQGYTLHKCSGCDDSYKDTYMKALGHKWVEGNKNYYCSKCNKSEAEGFKFNLATMNDKSCYTITNVSSSAVINGILEVPRKYESLPVRGIMNWSFSSVTSQVKKIIIHDNIKNIYSDIWHGTSIWNPEWDTMSTLEEIVFDETCSEMRIEAGAFNNCPKLSKANIKKGMIMYAPADDVLSQKGGNAEWLFKDTPYYTKNVTIINGLCYIADLLVHANPNETNSNVIIEEGTIMINSALLANFTFVKSLKIPNTVKSIGDKAFFYCSQLELIQFDGTIDEFNKITIGPSAFSGIKAKKIICSNGEVTKYYYNGWTYEIGK